MGAFLRSGALVARQTDASNKTAADHLPLPGDEVDPLGKRTEAVFGGRIAAGGGSSTVDDEVVVVLHHKSTVDLDDGAEGNSVVVAN